MLLKSSTIKISQGHRELLWRILLLVVESFVSIVFASSTAKLNKICHEYLPKNFLASFEQLLLKAAVPIDFSYPDDHVICEYLFIYIFHTTFNLKVFYVLSLQLH